MIQLQWHQAILRAFLSRFKTKNPATHRRTNATIFLDDGLSQAAEVLEERLLLSATVDVFEGLSYEEWKEQTFALETPTLVESNSDAQSGLIASQADLEVGINSAQSTSLIGLPAVFSTTSYRGTNSAVAIIDTGIDYTHSNLGGGWGNRVVDGYDFVNSDGDPMDDNGHGTNVAGIVGSDHATYTGIAPDVDLIALKVLGASGSGSFGDVELALQWVITNQATYNITAVNLSLGAGNYTSDPLAWLNDEFSTLETAGVFVAVSSGNSFYFYGSAQGLATPAISANTVSVGAVWDGNNGGVTWGDGARDYSTAADRITSFTQRSGNLDILAPGAFVTNTYLGGGFATLAGTSMAAPVIAGAAALLHEALDDTGQSALANQDDILALMQSTGVDVNDGDDEDDNVTNTGLNFKRLDLAAAMSSVIASSASIVQSGTTVDVYGTTGDDTFNYVAGSTMTVSVNSTFQNFALGDVNLVRYHGDAGTDTINITGSSGDETAVLNVGSAQFSGTGFTVTTENIEEANINAGTGTDIATFNDSSGDDRFRAQPTFARLLGTGFDNTATGFDRVEAYATNGGTDDRATLYDSPGDDRFTSQPTLARLRGTGFDNYVNGFDKVVAYATAGGTDDRATFYDSSGNDRFIANPTNARLKGTGFNNFASGFDRTYAYATAGGSDDRATFNDSAGDEMFIATPTDARLMGTGFNNYASGFDRTFAYATAGGTNDQAKFFDSSGNDRYIGSPTDARLKGTGFNNYASGFDKTFAYATAGGTDDRATLNDSSGDDRFIGTPTYARLRGTGFNNYVSGFDRVNAYATAGGTDDSAKFFDSSGDDRFRSDPTFAQMWGSGFFNYASGFDRVDAFATAGGTDDRAFFFDSAGNDAFTANGSDARQTGTGYNALAQGFDFVRTTSSNGGSDSLDFNSLDAVFEDVGNWVWI